MDVREQIPGWKEAVEQERFQRDAVFLGLIESIGPFEVLPLSLRHLLTLRLIRSPFLITGAPDDAKDIFRFLWVVWPDQSAKGRKKLMHACRQFTIPWWGPRAQARVMGRVQLITGQVRKYLADSLADWPPSGKGGDSYYSSAVAFCSVIAREYRWTEAVTLDMPLKKLFQYLAEIREFYGKPLLNPSSGKLVADWLLTQQEPDSLMGQLLAAQRN
jgi:hypothetical protein